MVESESAQDRAALRNGEMERPVVAHENRAAKIVRRHDFAEAAADAEEIADLHRERGLEIAFARARHTARRQQRMPDDEAALKPFIVVAVRAVVVVGERVEIEVRDQALLRGGDARAPVEMLRRRAARERIGGRILQNLEHGLDLVQLARGVCVRNGGKARGEIAHFE